MKLTTKITENEGEEGQIPTRLSDPMSPSQDSTPPSVISDMITSRSSCTLEFHNRCKLTIKDTDYNNDAYHNGTAITDQVELAHSDTIRLGSNRVELSCIPEVETISNSRSLISLQGSSSDNSPIKNASYSHKFNSTKGPIADTTNVKIDITMLAERFNSICTLASRLFAAQNENEIVDCALNVVFELSRPRRCAVVFINQTNNLLDLVGCKNSDLDAPKDVFPVSANIIRHVLNTEDSLIINTPNAFKADAQINTDEQSRVMCVPLHRRGGSLGVIYTETLGEYNKESDHNTLAVLASAGHQIGEAVEKIRLHAGLEKVFHGSMLALAASIEAKDKYTKGHSERVTCYALMISDEMGLSEEDRTVVELAGLLHDVGKIGVPESVLCSTGELSPEEFHYIKQHPQAGADIILKMPELKGMASVKDVANATKYHHERFAGGGYPSGISGDKIPLVARILAVADTFDAITSNRTYRHGQPAENAIKLLGDVSGTQIDPEVFRAFKKVYDRGDLAYPERVRTHIDFDAQILRESTVTTNSILD